MSDIIFRDDAINAAIDGADDWDGGYSPNREEVIRKYLAEVKTIDAIPVEWLKGLMLSTQDDVDKVEFTWIMREWQKEQEDGDGS